MFEYYWATNSTFDLQRSFTRKGCTVRITQLYMGTFDNAVMEYLSVLHVTLVTHQAVRYPLHPLPGVIGTQIAWYPIQTPRPQKRATRNARYPVRPLPNTSLYRRSRLRLHPNRVDSRKAKKGSSRRMLFSLKREG